jgi:hypothetical protein
MSKNTAPAALVVIPCGAAKLDSAAAARDLYASDNFALMLRAAEATAADDANYFGRETRVMILSAEHGLLDLDAIVAPYDRKMGDAGCVGADKVAAELAAIGATTVMSMLPSAYARVLRAAVDANNDSDAEWVELLDVFEDAPGIGFQRGVAASLNRTAA